MPKLDNYEQEIDALIGDRIRTRRSELGMSQAELASKIGMSFQQVQKYERGSNRIASSILLRVAEALDCPAGFFLEVGKKKKAAKKSVRAKTDETEIARLFQRLRQLRSSKARARIILLLNALLREEETAEPTKAGAKRVAQRPKSKPAKPPARGRRAAKK